MINIYTTKTCAFCHALMNYLNHKGVSFNEIKIDEIADGPQKLIEISGQLGVPVIDIAGEKIIGFDREAIDRSLQAKNLI